MEDIISEAVHVEAADYASQFFIVFWFVLVNLTQIKIIFEERTSNVKMAP